RERAPRERPQGPPRELEGRRHPPAGRRRSAHRLRQVDAARRSQRSADVNDLRTPWHVPFGFGIATVLLALVAAAVLVVSGIDAVATAVATLAPRDASLVEAAREGALARSAAGACVAVAVLALGGFVAARLVARERAVRRTARARARLARLGLLAG